MACDIVLTVYDNLELTRKCLDSIFNTFRAQDSLIIVDNGSGPETEKFLSALSSKHPDKALSLVRLVPNQGFIKAANAGLAHSKKECACLISNDTIVTKGWLDEMELLFSRQQDIGIIGPASNTYGLHPKPAQTPQELADSLAGFSGQYTESSSCVGFCMLIRREVLHKIGFLDEIYGQGYFEDTDYCRRAIAAGFRCVVSEASYVWHREHSTFQNASRQELFRMNKKIFQQRWGMPARILCILAARRLDVSAFEKELDFCLASARKGNWVWVLGVPEDRNELFKKLRVHGNIRMLAAPMTLLVLRGLFLVMAKQKKKIDCVYMSPALARNSAMLLPMFARPVKEFTDG